MEERIAVDVETAAEMIGVSRACLYPLVMAGDIPSFKIGRRRLVSVAGLREWAVVAAQGAGVDGPPVGRNPNDDTAAAMRH